MPRGHGRTVADDGLHRFSGPAKVFRSREEGLAAIRAGQVRPGQVLVLTGLGEGATLGG